MRQSETVMEENKNPNLNPWLRITQLTRILRGLYTIVTKIVRNCDFRVRRTYVKITSLMHESPWLCPISHLNH